jgi:hypothetical protein
MSDPVLCVNCGTPISQDENGDWWHDQECPEDSGCWNGDQGPTPPVMAEPNADSGASAKIIKLLDAGRAALSEAEQLMRYKPVMVEEIGTLLDRLDDIIVRFEPDAERYDAIVRGVQIDRSGDKS